MATWCEFTPAGSCPDLATARSELAALKAENERLRGALETVRDELVLYEPSVGLNVRLIGYIEHAALAPPEATEGEGK